MNKIVRTIDDLLLEVKDQEEKVVVEETTALPHEDAITESEDIMSRWAETPLTFVDSTASTSSITYTTGDLTLTTDEGIHVSVLDMFNIITTLQEEVARLKTEVEMLMLRG